MDRQLKLVIFAHARSGSSSLYRLLQLHSSLHIAEEPFHDSYHSWNPSEKNYVDHITDIPSLEEQLGALFAKYNGIKILQYQLPVALYTHLLLKPELRIVFLRRRNLLQAAVSGRIAEQTNIWKIWDLEGDITQT
jgi:LPS sulfotransferase NodH